MNASGHESGFEKARLAVLVPCRDEAATIGAVIESFKKALPSAVIFVYDNQSSDDTSAIAAQAGAIVRSEALPGKGNVVRRMFSDIEADIYILVDGDDTYDASGAPAMIQKLEDECLDMIVGARVAANESAYPSGHRLANALLPSRVACLWRQRI